MSNLIIISTIITTILLTFWSFILFRKYRKINTAKNSYKNFLKQISSGLALSPDGMFFLCIKDEFGRYQEIYGCLLNCFYPNLKAIDIYNKTDEELLTGKNFTLENFDFNNNELFKKIQSKLTKLDILLLKNGKPISAVLRIKNSIVYITGSVIYNGPNGVEKKIGCFGFVEKFETSEDAIKSFEHKKNCAKNFVCTLLEDDEIIYRIL